MIYEPYKPSASEIENFMDKGNWIQFAAKFGACFYDFNMENPSTGEWVSFAFSCCQKMEVLLKAVDYISTNEPNLKRPTLGKVKSVYFDLLSKSKADVSDAGLCSICNNERTLEVVEHRKNENGKEFVTLLNPGDTPQPYSAFQINQATSRCVCAGGQQFAADNRFGASRNKEGVIDGSAFVAARAYVSECIGLYNSQIKTDYTGGVGRPVK